MENASKALLIAGGVLLAMMILTVGLSLYNALSETTDQFVTKMDTDEISKFNSNFNIYKERKDITAQDIVTLYNFAEEYKNHSNINVEINLINTSNFTDDIEFLQDYSFSANAVVKFECTNITYDQNEGYVTSITFKKL